MNDLITHRAEAAARPAGIRWMPALGAAFAVAVALHLIVTRPMTARIEALSADVLEARAELAEVAGSRTDAWRTNDLLTALTIQAERVAEAERSLESVRGLNDDLDALTAQVEAVAAKTGRAMAVVARFETLHDRLAAAAGDAEGVRRDLDDLRDVTDRIDALAHVAPMHEQALDEVHARVSELSAVASDLIAHEDAVRRAASRVDEVVAMSRRLASADTSAASDAADELVGVAAALAAEGPALALDAGSAMTAMVAAADGMSGQADRLGELVETAEVVRQFEAEMAAHVRGLDDVRAKMVEFAMLEPAMAKVVGMLRPLTDVARIDRADADDLRAVVESMRAAGPAVPEPLQFAEGPAGGAVAR